MMRSVGQGRRTRELGGVLSRLRRDKRGNTLAIMAAALIPMIGFSGSAIDMARIYVAKVRLQQACDAGVLAGRKVMADTIVSTPLDDNAKTQAQTFFANNFRAGWYKTSSVTFKPVKATNGTDPTIANAVTGTASAVIPMTLMKFFGVEPYTLTVGCQAVYDMADTDVMFVLDTTGSMSCLPSDPANCSGSITSYTRGDGTTGYYNIEKSGSKLQALRDAVILFDKTIRDNADANTKYRYGFVTYSSSVNVGNLIYSRFPQYVQDDVLYQSRKVIGDYNSASTNTFTLTGIPLAYCVPQRNPATGYALTGPTWGDQGFYQARIYSNLSWKSSNNGTCSGTEQPLRPLWSYDQILINVRDYAAGKTVDNPTRVDASTSKWSGCVEELDTSTSGTFDVNNLPDDLNPDVKPIGLLNRWRPLWPDVEWTRNGPAETIKDENVWEGANYGPGTNRAMTAYAPCGMPVKQLQSWTPQQVKDYVTNVDFKAFGGTYHDVGMIWGTRMLSPNGIFAADTAAAAGRKDPTRNIVFMTDGSMAPNTTIYGQYGVEYLDNRTGGKNGDPTDTNNHAARFRVECDAAKKRGITIYVVAVGTSITSDLTYCASPGQTFQASSTSALTSAFKTIAQRVAMLRITQ
jgi:Flp pilus assembly protein TadG